MTPDQFAAHLRVERRRRGHTLQIVALDLGIAVTTLIGWEKGRRAPTSRDQWRQWADLFDLTVPAHIRPWRPTLAPCGTSSAYDRHIRELEPTDPACKAAHAARKRNSRANRKVAA